MGDGVGVGAAAGDVNTPKSDRWRSSGNYISGGFVLECRKESNASDPAECCRDTDS